MTAEAVPIWDMGRIKSFHPEMTMSIGAPAPDALEALAAGLKVAKFKIKHRDAGGFKAKYVDWVSIAGGTINWTSVEVSAESHPNGTDVRVTGGYEGTDRTGRKRAAEGLSAAVRDLTGRGIAVRTTPWAAPSDGSGDGPGPD